MSERLLRPSEVYERVALSDTEIRRRVAAGTFPAPIDLGPFTKRWSFLEIQRWMRERKAERPERLHAKGA